MKVVESELTAFRRSVVAYRDLTPLLHPLLNQKYIHVKILFPTILEEYFVTTDVHLQVNL